MRYSASESDYGVPARPLAPSPPPACQSSSCVASRAWRAPCSDRQGAHRLRSAGNSAGPPRPAHCQSICRHLSPRLSSTPLPRHTMVLPIWLKAFSTNSRTEWLSPVVSTYPSGVSISHIPSTKSRAGPQSRRALRTPRKRLLLHSMLDRRDRTRNLAGDEGFASNWTLVVEKDAGRGMHANGFQQAQRPKSIGVGGVFRRLERQLHMRLRREVVDLVGLSFLHDADDVGRVAIMHMEGNTLLVRIVNPVIDTLGIERG
jgi:hypothetical protein